jgi:colanic acid biosynthesis glycosyl transferase WcaI
MKILVCGLNYSPDLIGIAKYTGEMCDWLAARGHEIKVITAPPYYPNWQVPPDYQCRKYTKQNINGVSVIRCPFYVPKMPTGARRILHHGSFAISSCFAMLAVVPRFRPDIVIAIAPSILSAPAAWLAARSCGAAAWLHVQDFEIDAAFGLDFVAGNKLRRAALRFESMLLRRFDQVSSISEKMVELLAAKGVAPARLVEFRNWTDNDPDNSRQVSYRSALNISAGKTLLLYSGNMGTKQGLEYIVMAASQLVRSRSRLLRCRTDAEQAGQRF